MKQLFVEKSFTAAHENVIDAANGIIDDYLSQGYDLTLRQLYYQFIALDLFPDGWKVDIGGGVKTKNHERNYKKLGSILNDARLAGRVDWDSITDRTRELVTPYHERSVAGALENTFRCYTLDMWENQPARVEVWVEKEALIGVVERVCSRYDIPHFACRGYTSASSAYIAYQRVVENRDNDQNTVILHFGDHDPSGIDMSRDIEDRLALMLGEDDAHWFEIKRLALNWDQVKKYNPPPSPAKITDSRAGDYIAKFGLDSWELDALSPTQIADLVEKEVARHIDVEAWEETLERIKADKAKIRKFINEAD